MYTYETKTKRGKIVDLSRCSMKKIRELIVFTAFLVVALWKMCIRDRVLAVAFSEVEVIAADCSEIKEDSISNKKLEELFIAAKKVEGCLLYTSQDCSVFPSFLCAHGLFCKQ